MDEMRHGEGRYIANFFAQSWQIQDRLKEEEDRIPALPDTLGKGEKGGAAYPIGYFEDDPQTETQRLLGHLDITSGAE